jgi:hypothetical protein
MSFKKLKYKTSAFDMDLEFGHTYEDKLRELFQNKGKIEVKADRMAHETGNITIEFECRNKPSGISTTEADYWFYWIAEKDTGIMIEVSRLKEICKGKKVVDGGDDKAAKMYLIPLEEMIR